MCASRAGLTEGVIGRQDWYHAGGGECGFVLPDPRDWHIIYSNNEGFITRYDKMREQFQDISVWPIDNSGHGAVDLKHRFQWVSPFFLSPHNPDAIYTAAEAVFKSTDHGQTWTQISPDLTRNDKSKQTTERRPAPDRHHIGGILRHDFCAGRIAEAKRNALGRNRRRSCAGKRRMTARIGQMLRRKCRSGARVDLIEPSPHDANTAYVAVDRHQARRHQAVHFQDDRRGKNVDCDHEWHSRRRLRARGARRSEKARDALCRHGSSACLFRSTMARIGSRCS